MDTEQGAQSAQTPAYEHLVNLARKEKERERRGVQRGQTWAKF